MSTATPGLASQAAVDLLDVVRKQFWLIACCGALGLALAVGYWANSEIWYESRAKMLVSLKDMRVTESASSSVGTERIHDEILANHMEIVGSRQIINRALAKGNFDQLPSIQEHLSEKTDAADYILEHLILTKGGEGLARDARTLNIALRHTDAQDGFEILQALVLEYEAFLDDQVANILSSANRLVQEAQGKVERDLKDVEARYVEARKSAPVLYQGKDGGNVFLEKCRRLHDELVGVEIDRAAVESRLNKVVESLAAPTVGELDDFERLALIDNESLERLGTFAGLQLNTVNNVEFQAAQPARTQEAMARFSTLIQLKADLSKLLANFGPGHPQVENLKQEIALVEKSIEESHQLTRLDSVFQKLTPDRILKAYTGFLRHDLAALDERKQKLTAMAAEAEHQAKQLVEFELKDRMMLSEIERKQALYDGIVDQLRELDTATGLSGYVHQVLESPQPGESVWPDLKICIAGGLFLGLLLGFGCAILNHQLDTRFKTLSEIDALVGVPVIGQVGRIRKSRNPATKGRMIADAQAPEAEAFRLLRTYLLRDVKAGNLRTVMVTSCQMKDGKSTILANLGASFSELGTRTLIIDGDMRAPTMNRFFDIPIDHGLSELLQGQAALDDVIRPSGIDGLSLLTAGAAVRNPAELLQSESFDHLLDRLKGTFDLIMIDSGPVLLVSDPAIVSQKCDSALLVVRASTDTKTKVREAVRRLKESKANLRGCIVNTFGSGKEFTQNTGYSSQYYYGYGYGGYGRRVKEKNGENGHPAVPAPKSLKTIESNRG
jgi:capsular exopolysaccharide synthesis family protein